jgi:hypothetical protein
MNCAFAQEIKGVVFDENIKPVQGISVYLDGTTTGFITNSKGEFLLKSQKINTSLVISAVGYETIYVENPFEKNNQQFYLSVKNEDLQEIVIRKEMFSRKQKLLVFKTYFLGDTRAGKACVILNENDIDLDYDYNKNTLTASCKNPIQISNLYLGYEVGFTIYKFNVQFSQKSIKTNDVQRSVFLGTTFYKSVLDSKKIIKRRKEVFLGSKAHFFKNLTQNVWNKKNFLLFKGSFPTKSDNHFLITDQGDLFKIDILSNDLAKLKFEKDIFKSSFNVLYNNSNQSKVIFGCSIFFVDKFGNNSNGENIDFSGHLSLAKVGDLLPINYEP